MKLSKRYCLLMWLIILNNNCNAQVSLDGDETIPVWCDEKTLDLIVSKLNEINAKVDLLNRKSIDSETQLMSLSETMNNFNRTLHAEIANQAEAQRIQIEKFTNAFNTQQMKTENPSQVNAETLPLSTAKFEAGIKNLTFLLNGNQQQLNNIETQIEQALKSERNAENSGLSQKIDLLLSRDINYEENNKQIVSLLNAANNEINSAQQQIKDGFAKFDALSNSVTNVQQNRLESLRIDSQSLKNSILPFINRMNNGFSDYITSFASCEQALQSTGDDGVYNLYLPDAGLPPFKAYCLQDPDKLDIGYTVIQQRKDGSVSFVQKWHAYKHGFGDSSGEHWLGLEKVYAMTSKQNYEFRLDLDDETGSRKYIVYGTFEIGSEEEKYYLKKLTWYKPGVPGYSVSAGSKKLKFTTIDEDNDADDKQNCAIVNKSAWWYSQCDVSSLNGLYKDLEYGKKGGAWMNFNTSVKYTRMAIRPSKTTYVEEV